MTGESTTRDAGVGPAATPRTTLRRCAAVVDGAGVRHAPGALLHRGSTVLAVGTPQAIGPVADIEVVQDDQAVLVPALVNAHVHLDLSHLGAAVSFGGSFVEWIELVRAGRRTEPEAIAASTQLGIDLALIGGTGAVGDIAGIGSRVPIETLAASPLAGVGFVELFGFGARAADAIERIRRERDDAGGRLEAGWQPHAPYSCAPEVYAAAAASGRPVSTHLAETRDELAFVRSGTGSIAAFLRGLGIEPGPPGGAEHPALLLARELRAAPWLIAHLNYIDGLDDRALADLAEAGATVAYCPRAHAYFGHADHPYRTLRAAGVRVALGTDGLLCTDRPDRLSVLDEMRLLARRDDAAPADLLEMATVAGAAALGIDAALVTLAPGPTLGLLRLEAGPGAAEDALQRALARDEAPAWIARPDGGRPLS